MQLKRVDEEVSKRYAKKDEILRKEVKKFTPTKWLVASSAGLVTLLYTSPSNSIHKIGIVFGCIEIAEPGYNYSIQWNITNSIMDVFYYASWILGVAFIFMLGRHMINKKKYEEDKRLKSVKHIKILTIIFIISVIITASLVFVLNLDKFSNTDYKTAEVLQSTIY